MIRRPPRSTRTDTLFPYTTLFRSTIGGDTQHQSYNVLRVGGQLLATAMPPDEALAKAHQVEAGFVFHASDGERLRRLVEAIDKRDVTILIDRKVPLDRFADAFAHQASGRARGKIIVEVRSEENTSELQSLMR